MRECLVKQAEQEFSLYLLPLISLQYQIMEIMKKIPKKDLKTGLK